MDEDMKEEISTQAERNPVSVSAQLWENTKLYLRTDIADMERQLQDKRTLLQQMEMVDPEGAAPVPAPDLLDKASASATFSVHALALLRTIFNLPRQMFAPAPSPPVLKSQSPGQTP
jgi:hypothetical protein